MYLKRHRKSKLRKSFIKENIQMMLMAIPGIVLLFIFNYLPLTGIALAFKKYKPMLGIWGSPWIGFDNFKFFFMSSDALRVIRNTVLYSLTFIIFDLITAVGLALMLYYLKSRKATKFYNTVVILPKFMSMVVIAFIVYALLSPTFGVFNQVLERFGVEAINWYAEPEYWPAILTVTHIWQVVGMNSVLYYSSLMGMDESLLEAAKVDGANLKQQIWHVIIPHLVPIMIITTILALGHIFSGNLDLYYQVPRNQGLLYPTTDVINTYVYRALQGGSLESSTAVNLFQSIVGFVMVILANGVIRKISPENSMF